MVGRRNFDSVKNTINHLIKRLGFFVIIYISLVALVNIFDFKNIYHHHFIKFGNTAFSNFAKEGIVVFKDGFSINKKKYNSYDCAVILTSKPQKKNAREEAKKNGTGKMTYNPVTFPLNSWNNFGFLLLFFISISIALPLHLKNKLITVVIGFLLIYLFFYIKIWASLNLKFSIWYNLFEVGWTNDFFVNLLSYFNIIIMYPFFGLVIITLFTLFLSFKYWILK